MGEGVRLPTPGGVGGGGAFTLFPFHWPGLGHVTQSTGSRRGRLALRLENEPTVVLGPREDTVVPVARPLIVLMGSAEPLAAPATWGEKLVSGESKK